MKHKKLIYATYQTFPAMTANSLQSISNIKYLVKNNIDVDLYFPLREKQSTDNIEKLKKFYDLDETFNAFGVIHNYPHGKIKTFSKLWFHLSHYLWSKKLVQKYFKGDDENYFFTRSDWIAYFLAKQKSNVAFECHQDSKVRNFIIKKIGDLDNVKFIFLNENLQNKYNGVQQSTVLHNAADSSLFVNSKVAPNNSIVFLGNASRFNKSRGLGQIITWFLDDYLKENFTLEIIGGSKEETNKLKEEVEKLQLTKNINVEPWVGRKEAISKLSNSKYGLLINSPENNHSYLYTSPLKYFEYLYSGLLVLAVDFPSHKILPFNEKIIFFENGNKDDFIQKLKSSNNNISISDQEKYLISLENRAKKIIDYIF